ncbi:MAG TPA: hypothetical protein PKJ65_05915, partial [Clostridia bacterium]|nr:hypothetical protein [Clostridia bacterium]
MKFYLENGGHHKGNKGDMAILISLIREFEEIWPGSTYFIPLPDPGVDVSSKPQLHFIIPLEDYVIRTGQSNGRWRIAWRMFKTILKTYSLKICKHHLKNGSLDRCLASMMESDAMVLTG